MIEDIVALWEWRRSVAEFYRDIRESASPESAWRLWCDRRTQMFQSHPQSPIDPDQRSAHAGPRMFEYDPTLRIRVGLDAPAAEQLEMAAGADGTVAMVAFAQTKGLAERCGGELKLWWIGGYGGGVFLPFLDATSGPETYGGGRYLIDTIKGADPAAREPDGTLWLDFNFSYFPSCAYSPRWVCPLAPRGNRLPAAIRAGERLPHAP